jgi:hypothetical protein
MFYHGYDSTTGEFLFCGHDPEPDEAARLEALGQILVEAPGWGSEDRKDYHYKDGALTPKAIVTFTPDKAEIAAGGEDQAVVSVQVSGDSPPASIMIEVDGLAVEVALADGQGQLPPIISPLAHTFSIRVADQVTYQDNGGCTVAAQEV